MKRLILESQPARSRAVGRTPFGNKNLINKRLGIKPAFENRKKMVLKPEFCWLRSIDCIAN
jgi:hypothetical protein